ncbi:MAG: cyclic pyranopterin monophosphate synthase MoaC [Smithellaceae bacterium]
MNKLSHIDDQGQVQMVDVTGKDTTVRMARAQGVIRLKPETLAQIAEGQMAKGDVFTTAKIAGIMAAKQTGALIPMCHPLSLTGVDMTFEIDRQNSRIIIGAEARTVGPTGVEMEALTAVSVAALTVYDMCKAADKEMVIGPVVLLEKSGGRSGHFIRKTE